jgi:hypothetical protein
VKVLATFFRGTCAAGRLAESIIIDPEYTPRSPTVPGFTVPDPPPPVDSLATSVQTVPMRVSCRLTDAGQVHVELKRISAPESTVVFESPQKRVMDCPGHPLVKLVIVVGPLLVVIKFWCESILGVVPLGRIVGVGSTDGTWPWA